MADQPIPFWRKLGDALGFSDAELRAAPAAPAVSAASAAAGASAAASAGASPSSPSATTPGAPSAAAPATPPSAAPVASPGAPGAAPASPAPEDPDPEPAPEAETLLELWFAREDNVESIWQWCVPGPGVAEIATRLSLVPPAFLADGVGILPLTVHILEAEYGGTVVAGAQMPDRRVLATASAIRATESSAARRGAALVLWLWASDDLHGPLSVPLAMVWPDRVLAALAFRLAAVVDPAEWVRDADRRDEAARQILFWSGQLPAGEDKATARSILAMRDSLQQHSALAQTLAEHEHRLEVSRRLRDAQAREAAARYSNE